ncbi:MerR family transcriptional regulator [Vagococcus hydrophili]|uniref:MerR family transcriptional regulator n=1 Tax=Vagococcus hydrophili TaxID=2714947 RepID=A0A6G8AXF3_9ENTE|nr:MerR family transcriptional regulator [Vagococcus hydrophili]QIL49781.1 MerR family transcriptional regulator [Vagococcus hydrophili]
MLNASIKYLLENDTLLVGISELSKMSGVSPRQLRYWEEKGFIESISKDDKSARQYRLPVVLKVEIIKGYLDEGYTLSKAVEKSNQKIKNMLHIRQFFRRAFKDIEVIDDQFINLSFGDFEPNNEELYISYDIEEDKLTYKTSIDDKK